MNISEHAARNQSDWVHTMTLWTWNALVPSFDLKVAVLAAIEGAKDFVSPVLTIKFDCLSVSGESMLSCRSQDRNRELCAPSST